MVITLNLEDRLTIVKLKLMLKYIISYTEIKSQAVNLGMGLLRVFTGLAIAFGHGLHKLPPSEGFINGVADLGFPLPGVFGWLASISEFFGGIFLALGLLTRPSSIFLTITMVVAAFLRHADDPYSVKEKPILFMMIFILYFLAGPGKYSIDQLLKKKLQ